MGSPATMKRQSATLVWSFGVVAIYSLYLTTSAHWKQSADKEVDILDTLFLDFTRRGNYTLARAPAVVHLERRVDVDPMLGICFNEKPVLQNVPEDVCQELQCLWVEDLQLNIDIARNPLRVLPGPSEVKASRCSLPKGGQKRPSSGERVHISFILTMHNHPTITAQCLLELFRTAREVPSAEYVIIDDGSTEDTSPLLQTMWRLEQLFGIQVKYRRNEQAVGYGPANANGIHLASGKYIALINNDMFVVKGWLTAVMQTFETTPNAGIVGPMFMGTNDLITEAGGLIFSDAGAANYARGREPFHEIYFMHKADYISAACVVMLKETYKKIGGFDPQYIMGYYEDTDLAMAVRVAGLEVLVQPLAVNYHQEGGTFGTESTSDLKRRLMAENKEKFLAKWGHILQEKHCPSDTDHFVAFNRAYPKLLWVDDIVPEPDRDAGSIRNINLLRILLEAGYHVTFIPTAGGREQHYVTQLRLMGVHVFPVMPPEQWMLQYNGKCMFDVIMVARRLVFEAAQGQLGQHCPGVPMIYDTVDLHFLRESRQAITAMMEEQGPAWDFQGITTQKVIEWLDQQTPEAEKVRHARNVELYFMEKSQLTVVVSPQEVDLIHHFLPQAKVSVVTVIHDLSSLADTQCEGRMGTLFVGNMNHLPNRQAIEGLIKEVLPIVLKMMPAHLIERFKMHIVGSNVVPDYLLKLFSQNKGYVVFHGQLSDNELFSLYDKVKASVAPLLSGAGVKGKVNQAMKYGVPVVATPIAVEGMYGQDGINCMIATSPEEFARKIVQLHTDCSLWQRLVDGGRRVMKEYFSIEANRPAFLQALSDVGHGPLPQHMRGTCRTRLTSESEKHSGNS